MAAQDLEVAPEAVADRGRDIPPRVAPGLHPHHEVGAVAVVQAPLPVPGIVVRPGLVVPVRALRRLFPGAAENVDGALVARVLGDVVRLPDHHRALLEIVAGDDHVVAEAGVLHRRLHVGKARRGQRAVGKQQAVVQPDLHRDAAVDEAAQLLEGLLEASLGVFLPVAAEAERARGVLPHLVERALAAVEGGRAPGRAPAEREAVAARAVGEQHVRLAPVAQHPEHAGEVAAPRVAVLGVALGAEPGHRVVAVGVRSYFRHDRLGFSNEGIH